MILVDSVPSSCSSTMAPLQHRAHMSGNTLKNNKNHPN